MNAEYKDGRLSFHFTDVLDNMSADEKRELIESLSCDAEIVKFVGQQIIDKWTESGFYSGVSCVATSEAYHGLDKVWRDVAKASGDVAKREIERLEDALRCEKKNTELAWAEYRKATDRRYA
jgi:hypothetical protein